MVRNARESQGWIVISAFHMRYFGPSHHSWHFPCPRTDSFLLELSPPLFVDILWDILLKVLSLKRSKFCQQHCLSYNTVFCFSVLFFPFSRGFAVGIYTTNSPEACHYVAENCSANIIVVENHKQLQKILEVIMFSKWLGVPATWWQMWEGRMLWEGITWGQCWLWEQMWPPWCAPCSSQVSWHWHCVSQEVMWCFHFLKALSLK